MPLCLTNADTKSYVLWHRGKDAWTNYKTGVLAVAQSPYFCTFLELYNEEGWVRFFPTLHHLLAEKLRDMLSPTLKWHFFLLSSPFLLFRESQELHSRGKGLGLGSRNPSIHSAFSSITWEAGEVCSPGTGAGTQILFRAGKPQPCPLAFWLPRPGRAMGEWSQGTKNQSVEEASWT